MTTWSMSATFASLSEQLQFQRHFAKITASLIAAALPPLPPALREFTHGRLPLSP